MFDKDKIEFHGDNLNECHGPFCDYAMCVVGSDNCMICPCCYGRKVRTWNKHDDDGTTWYNAGFNGYVLCAKNNPKFVAKIKNHIFKLTGKKSTIKNLSNERT